MSFESDVKKEESLPLGDGKLGTQELQFVIVAGLRWKKMIVRNLSLVLSRGVALIESTGNNTKNRIAMLADAVFSLMALCSAFVLRGVEWHNFDGSLWPIFVVLPIVSVLIFRWLGAYGLVFEFGSVGSRKPFLVGALLSSFCLALGMFLIAPDPNPRSVFVIYGLVLILFSGGIRRLWSDFTHGANSDKGEPIAIYGAGSLGRQVFDICRNGTDYRPVLWLDDDEKYQGRNLCEMTVLDPKNQATPELLKAHGVETILMAIGSIKGSEMKDHLESLQSLRCRVQALPSFSDLVGNRVSSQDALTLPLEQLIGRQQVAPDAALMKKNISGKVVMVTGAGGSVGGELCRQILPLNPAALVLFDISEASIYLIHQDLRALVAAGDIASSQLPSIHCVLGNVINKEEVSNTIKKYAVNTLFHAAAYKHVPMVEINPQPAIRTNVFGTLAVVAAAVENNIENFLFISTDKAVRPTNIMGATKRIAEMIVQAKSARTGGAVTCFSIVRFGNVIGSSGSVVPKFSEQIEMGGPVTVTDRNVVRYFMSIPEAAQLVIQASALAQRGEIFLLDMGEPVLVADLAKSLVYLHGKSLKDDNNPNGEIEIIYTGLREGEKMYEELLIDEAADQTSHSKIFRAMESFIEWDALMSALVQIDKTMKSDPESSMVDELRSLVDGYTPNRSPKLQQQSQQPEIEKSLACS